MVVTFPQVAPVRMLCTVWWATPQISAMSRTDMPSVASLSRLAIHFRRRATGGASYRRRPVGH